MLRVPFLEHPEQPFGIDLVGVRFIHLERAVISRAPKLVPCVRVGRVDITTGIDDERNTAKVVFKREKLIVLVVAEPARADHPVRNRDIGGFIT